MMLASLVAQGGFAPRGDRAGTADRGLAFAAAVRMVVGVHNGTTDSRAPAHMAFAAGFADRDVFMVDVADLADAGEAVDIDVALFAGGQADQGVIPFLRHQLRHVAGGADQLGALAGIELDAVDESTERDVRERQRVAGLDVGVGAVADDVADLEAVGGEDIPFLEIGRAHV